jgi:hypothetical protein
VVGVATAGALPFVLSGLMGPVGDPEFYAGLTPSAKRIFTVFMLLGL